MKIQNGFRILVAVVALFCCVAPLRAQSDSPAYQSYLELLKVKDPAFGAATYACFSDDSQSTVFKVISASVLDRSMVVITTNFRSGVSNPEGVFEGRLSSFSQPDHIFATLVNVFMKDAPRGSGHDTDSFEWGPDVLIQTAGFGKRSVGVALFTYEFKMQRSTGRYREEQRFENNDPVIDTGKCVRVPHTRTPEDEYAIENE